jgi:hypothetical protein
MLCDDYEIRIPGLPVQWLARTEHDDGRLVWELY